MQTIWHTWFTLSQQLHQYLTHYKKALDIQLYNEQCFIDLPSTQAPPQQKLQPTVSPIEYEAFPNLLFPTISEMNLDLAIPMQPPPTTDRISHANLLTDHSPNNLLKEINKTQIIYASSLSAWKECFAQNGI